MPGVLAVIVQNIQKGPSPQLTKDRELRDLEHVRAVLHAFVSETFDVEAATALMTALKRTPAEPESETLRSRVNDDVTRIISMNNRKFALTVVLGPQAPLVGRLSELSAALDAFQGAAKTLIASRAEHGRLDGDEQEVEHALSDYTTAIAAFLKCAYETAGWSTGA